MANDHSNNQFHKYFSADRPISTRPDDKLGRRPFAEALARSVVGWTHKESLVLALYGPWGIGKSSIKNMVVDTIKETAQKSVVVAEFNPWQFANRDHLHGAFFDQIGISLGKGTLGTQTNERRLLGKWQRYRAYLTLGQSLLDIARKPIGIIVSICGVLLWILNGTDFRAAASWLSIALAAFGVILAFWSGAADFLIRYLSVGTEIGRKSIDEVKDDLAQELRKLNKPVLIILDDLDRLTPNETIEMFQIVKANADLPNLVYLLLCDRNVVRDHIQTVLRMPGDDFIEKIVQVGFDVPAIERGRLLRVLTTGLDALLADESVATAFDQVRWGNLFVGGLDTYFDNVRDVNRFLSTLAFHVALLRGAHSFEVNIIDLITLEVLRTFEPNVYRGLLREKQLLTSTYRSSSGHREEADRKAVTAIVEAADEARRPIVRQIVKHLFPPVEWAIGGSHYDTAFSDAWERDRRVCSEDVFDRYFNFTIPEGDVSQDVIQGVLALAGDREALRETLESLRHRDQLGTVLDRLEVYKQTVPLESLGPFITALFDVSDDVSDDDRGMFSMSPMMHLSRIALWALKREPAQAKRDAVVTGAVRATSALKGPAHFVSLARQAKEKAKKHGSTDEDLISDQALTIAEQACLQKMKARAADGSLARMDSLLGLLYCWREWENEEAPKEFVRHMVATPEGAVRVAEIFLQRSITSGMGDRVSRVNWYISLKITDNFVAADEVCRQFENIAVEKLSERQRTAVEAFRRAVALRTAGKPEDDFLSTEDD